MIVQVGYYYPLVEDNKLPNKIGIQSCGGWQYPKRMSTFPIDVHDCQIGWQRDVMLT